MKPWEKELFDSSTEFVNRVCQRLPEDIRAEVAQKIYRAMCKSIKPFQNGEKDEPPKKNVWARPRRRDRAKFETIRLQADGPEKKATLLKEYGHFLDGLGFVDPHTWPCWAIQTEIDHILPYRVRGREYANPDMAPTNVYLFGGRAKTPDRHGGDGSVA